MTSVINVIIIRITKTERGKSKKVKKKLMNKPGAWEFVKPSGAGENNDSNLCITKNWQFFGLLEQPITAFREGDLPAIHVFNLLNLNPSSPHSFSGVCVVFCIHHWDKENRETQSNRIIKRTKVYLWLYYAITRLLI